jgi:hypothetical protein
MLAFDLLRVGFADGVSRGGEMAVVDSRRIRIAMLQPKRLEQLLSLDTHFIRSTPEHICQDDSGEMGNRMPQPPLVGFAPHKTPHLINLRSFNSADFHRNCVRTTSLDHAFVHRRKGARFFLIP